MAEIDLGRILKNIFGKNLDEMSDAELVEKMKDISAPTKISCLMMICSLFHRISG